jgi:hypothetical protein
MEKRLFIFVEGGDDIRFFGRLVKPLIIQRYQSVELIAYACIKREKINKFLRSLAKLGHDYIFVADIDCEPSVEAKKHVLTCRFSDLGNDHVVIVIQEIESWYLAGLNDEASAKLGVPCLDLTNTITKEDFNRMIPYRFASKIDFMFEILKFFSVEIAIQKNRSFRFFVRKYQICEGAEVQGTPVHKRTGQVSGNPPPRMPESKPIN